MVTAMVTGGTSGIGAAFARALADRGDNLVIVARDETRLAETAESLRTEYGIDVETISADLGERADVLRVAARLEDTSSPIDMLVNNAGFGVHASLLAVDTTPHERAIEVMIRGVLMLGAAAGRTMRERGSGTIVNVSSVAGFITMGSYSAVKAWVASYSQGLSVELRGSGVQVTTLCPGWVKTEFHARAGIRESSIPNFLWVDVDELVAACLADVQKGKVISVPSRRFQFLMFVIKHAPRSGIRWASGKISSSRND
ncbi:short-chain dehydrogenase [Subtercola boreus]|uniref:Short-chain dehydrogenase n=1 Tax=Subtercola boreus TaxID=120213 RepID=A0A3E0W3C9_9MICO|nr:SDR family NAD(P)-dependent oxidoreductase [Subtercola boreus]RFA16822.1 short-chain dehydrogenase [Subtercola boreus]